jgi:hypothetical protein
LETARAVAKFRKAGIIEIKKAEAAPSPIPTTPVVENTPSAAPAHTGMMTPEAGGQPAEAPTGSVRYWRGKPVQE